MATIKTEIPLNIRIKAEPDIANTSTEELIEGNVTENSIGDTNIVEITKMEVNYLETTVEATLIEEPLIVKTENEDIAKPLIVKTENEDIAKAHDIEFLEDSSDEPNSAKRRRTSPDNPTKSSSERPKRNTRQTNEKMKSKKRRIKPKVQKDWDKADIYKLIGLVKNETCLWNASDDGYHNKILRNNAWRKISEIFDSKYFPTELCAKWTNLRIQFRGYAGRAKTKSDQGLVETPKWKFFNAMCFVDQAEQQQTQPTISNLTLESESDSYSLDQTITTTPPLSTVRRSQFANSSSAATEIAETKREAVTTMREHNQNVLDPNVSFGNYLASELTLLSDSAAASPENPTKSNEAKGTRRTSAKCKATTNKKKTHPEEVSNKENEHDKASMAQENVVTFTIYSIEEAKVLNNTLTSEEDKTSDRTISSIKSEPTDLHTPLDAETLLIGSVKSFVCDECPKSFKKHALLVEHKRLHTDEKTFQCDICNRQFRERLLFNRHKRRHSKEKKYKCEICAMGCSTKQNFDSHMRIHTNDRRFKCSFCPKAFVRSSDLKIHERVHTGEKPFVCDICHRCFRANQNLIVHKKSHMGDTAKIFKCEHCDKKFMRNIDRKVHMRSHTGEKPFKCEICDRGYFSKFNVKAHIERDHNSGSTRKKVGRKPKELRAELEKQRKLIEELQQQLLQQNKTDEKSIPSEGLS